MSALPDAAILRITINMEMLIYRDGQAGKDDRFGIAVIWK
jgi:hypothetical protein